MKREAEQSLLKRMRKRQIRDGSLALNQVRSLASSLGTCNKVLVAELDTLWIASSATSVADDVDVLYFRCYAWRARIFADIYHIFEGVERRTKSLSFSFQFSINGLNSNDNQVLDFTSLAIFLHVEDFLGEVIRAEYRGHLSLVEDVIDLGCTHGIIESYSGHFVVHAR